MAKYEFVYISGLVSFVPANAAAREKFGNQDDISDCENSPFSDKWKKNWYGAWKRPDLSGDDWKENNNRYLEACRQDLGSDFSISAVDALSDVDPNSDLYKELLLTFNRSELT